MLASFGKTGITATNQLLRHCIIKTNIGIKLLKIVNSQVVSYSQRSQGRQTLLIFFYLQNMFNRVVLVCTVNVLHTH